MIKARSFYVPGEPRGKARPRTAIVSGKEWHYTPETTRQYESWVRDHYMDQCRGVEGIPKGVNVCISIDAIFPVPDSASRKRREQMLSGIIRPTKKPDADNILKIVADALNGLAYHDDAQIVSAMVTKLYGPEPMVRVWISEAD